MTDETKATESNADAGTDAPSIPEAAPAAQPRFDEPDRPAPSVIDPPARNTEF